MDDTKDLVKTLKDLTEALEAGKYVKTPSELVQGAALKVDRQSTLSKKYLSEESLEILKRPKATQLLHIEGGSCTHKCVFYGVRVRTDQIEKGVEKMANIMNDLVAKGQIHSILSEISSLDLYRGPGEVENSVVVFYPLVSVELADEMDKNRPKYYVREGEIGPSIDKGDDYKLVLPPGQFMAEARVTTMLYEHMNSGRRYDVNGVLFNIVHEYLNALPKGTKFLGANKCGATDLSIPYELFFENPLLQNISRVDLDYVRSVAMVGEKLEQFNLHLGIRFYDKSGNLLYDYK